ERARAYGIQPGALNEQLAMLVGGRELAELREGQRTVPLVLRLAPEWRETPGRLMDLPIQTDTGRRIPLHLVAHIREGRGPNAILRENGVRRTVVSANTTRRDLETIVTRWEEEVAETVSLPPGYSIRFEGEFRARREASRRIALLSAAVLAVIALMLH